MSDRIERLGDSLIQHGSNSQRIYLMKLASRDCPGIIDRLDALAGRQRYTKIFAKVPVSASPFFLDRGYLAEARIPRLYRGQEEGVMLGKFLQPERKIECRADLVKDVLAKAHAKVHAEVKRAAKSKAGALLPEGCVHRSLVESDIQAAAAVYREVFASYPFPIHDPAYLLETMRDHVRYFGVWHEGRLVALASAELDRAAGHAEMTDFATLPSHRGQGFAQALLRFMEQEIKGDGMRTAFTIARAYSHGMNVTFARAGYRFGGTLGNNTQICGRLESMNVWYKPIC